MSVHDVLYAAVTEKITPGAVALCAAGGDGPRLLVTTGKLGWQKGHAIVAADTRYDLASLTKLLVTTVVAAGAASEGRLDLNEEPWPSWPGVTVRHALRHDGGLLPWSPFYEEAIADRSVGLPAGRAKILAAVLATEPTCPPGQEIRYSDLGFIALGALLEDRLGDRLDRLFAGYAQDAWANSAPRGGFPFGLHFVPIFEEGHDRPLARVAPTERCPWRGRVVQGQVHDDNAFAMGGIAGHAGLFGSILDVEKAARFLLTCVRGDALSSATQSTLASSKLGQTLFAWAKEPHARGLGFDRADKEGTTGGVLSDRAVGHLGFTGTSLWLDPDLGPAGAFFILLTNRVHERRDGEGIADLRKQFHRAGHAWLVDRLVDQRGDQRGA